MRFFCICRKIVVTLRTEYVYSHLYNMKNRLFVLLMAIAACSLVCAMPPASHAMGDSTVTIYDTVCCQEPYIFFGNEHTYVCVDLENEPYVNHELEHYDEVADILYICKLTIVPIRHVAVEDTILLGDTLFFCGDTLLDAGVYEYTLTSAVGCDSVVQLTLHTQVEEVEVEELVVSTICADDGVIALQLDHTGRLDSLAVHFELDSLPTGLHDTIVPIAEDGSVVIAYEELRAGVYKAKLTGYYHQILLFESETTITVQFPSSVLEYRWDDVICVLTSAYNGGYDFVAFQWYKNGQPLIGETGYYLNHPLEEDAEYTVLLTQADSTQLMSCPILLEKEEPEISVEPTLVKQRQPVRCHVPENAMVYLYDALGRMMMQESVAHGETYLTMPGVHGVYLMKVVMQDNHERSVKIIVN